MQCWGATDRGIVRNVNQDYFIANTIAELDIAIMVICDGMGGANAGHIASKYAANCFYDEIRMNIRADMDDTYIKKIMTIAMNKSNTFVFDMSIKEPEFNGMGTTLVGAISTREKTYIINIGDSRGYSITENNITQITRDHSLVAEMIKNGKITEKQAQNHPQKNYITRAVGVEKNVESDIFIIDNKLGIMLCSDGVSNMILDDDIYNIIKNNENLEMLCKNVIGTANKNGGKDNISFAILRF